MRHPYFDLPTPIPIAHRGCSGERPENTLPAFTRGLEQGALILESDTHPTRDGHAVLIHDSELERTTDGRGNVSSFTLEELRQLDAGHGFSADGASYPFRGMGIRIPTLAEAFEVFPEVRFNLEIKQGGVDFIEQVVKQIAAAGRAERTLLAAAGDDQMERIREVVARLQVPVAIGASAGDVVGFVRSAQSGETPPRDPMALQIPPDFAGRPLVTPELVAHAHAHDVQVHVWTVNEPAEITRLLELGVDGVMSDFPARVVEAIRARS